MARYRKIDTRIWNDQKFNQLSDDGKFVFMFVLTHQHLMPIGAMRATIAGLASELHWDLNRFQQAFEHVASLNMMNFDSTSCLLWLPNFLKYNQPESPNVVKSYHDYLDYLPECELKDTLIHKIAYYVSGISKAYRDALPEAFRKAICNQEQEQDQEQEQEETITSGKPDTNLKNTYLNSTNHSDELRNQAVEILNFLNEKAGKAFQPTEANLKLIMARLKSGASVMECRQVIVRKCRAWKDDPKMQEYLRPATLFNAEKFEQYRGELVVDDEDEQDALS